MKYMGSKSRVAKYIVPIIQDCINKTDAAAYYEPFCGGCNIIDKVDCTLKFATDINPYLIALFNRVKSGEQLLDEVPRELYSEVREKYRTGCYEDWFVGNVGFLASYNGRFFDGGYAQPGYETTKTERRYRDYYREAKDNIMAQRENLKDVDFHTLDYRLINPTKAVVYLDPPYQNQKQYSNSKSFDYDEFWGWVRKISKNNVVLISEMSAPDDFECIWEKSVSRSIKAMDKSRATEKLFVMKVGE